MCDETIGVTVGCVLKISHSQQPVPPCRERLHHPADRGGRKKESVTSQPVLCGSVLPGSDLQADVSAGQRGEEEGRRPLQAQSRTVTAVLKDRGTPPSCEGQKATTKQSEDICAGQV